MIDDNEAEGGGDDAPWMATFCDICMLLLCFFVLILSMSTTDKRRFGESFSAIRATFGGLGSATPNELTGSPEENVELQDMVRFQRELEEAQKQDFDELRQLITSNNLDQFVNATLDEGIITLRLPSSVMFEASSERISPNGLSLLTYMRNILLKMREQNVNIRGYTDDSPIEPGLRFKDNWELSALRAVNVLRTLISGGIEPVRMTASGMGDLNPLAPNTTEENRAMNRRVEFVLTRNVSNENK